MSSVNVTSCKKMHQVCAVTGAIYGVIPEITVQDFLEKNVTFSRKIMKLVYEVVTFFRNMCCLAGGAKVL